MYIPPHFAVTNPQVLHEVIRRYPLGLLITQHQGLLHTTHLPFHLDAYEDGGARLEAHLAKANPHCAALHACASSLIVFQGPNAYVSPRWYADPEHNVPTWNYVAVHAHGNPRAIDDPARTLEIIGTLTDEHERYIENPWRIDEARPYAERLVSQVLAFEIEVLSLEGKFKLSQNRSPQDRARVMQQLSVSSSDGSQEMLTLMQNLYREDGSTR